MPLYEYVCQGCELKFETLVKRWGDPVSCPGCRGESVEKQLSTFAVAGPSPREDSSCAMPSGGCGASACGGGACGLPN
jgi:putative FmdB family regulatory protein